MLFYSFISVSQGEDRNLFTRGGYSNLESKTGVNDIFKSTSDKRYYTEETSFDVRIVLDNDQITNVVPGKIDFNNENIDVEVGVDGLSIGKKYFKTIEVYKKIDNGSTDTLLYVNSNLVFNDKKSKILEVLVDKNKILLKHLKVKFVKSNYNKALDIGNKEDTFKVKEIYYYFTGDKLVRVPFGSTKMIGFIEKYGLGGNSNYSINSEDDLIRLFNK